MIEQNEGMCICVAFDFNSIREIHERVGSGSSVDNQDILVFDNFINQSGLVDLILLDMSYTYCRADGSCKSRP